MSASGAAEPAKVGGVTRPPICGTTRSSCMRFTIEWIRSSSRSGVPARMRGAPEKS